MIVAVLTMPSLSPLPTQRQNSTWIVIILIIVACAVAVGEISARFLVGANRSAEDGFRAFSAIRKAPALALPSPSTPYFAINGDSL